MGQVVVQQNRFTDLNLSMAINPQTNDIAKRTNIEAIKFAVKSLILTNHYERPFHPEIGTNVRSMLFENSSPLFGIVLQKIIQQVLDQYEPRAILKGVVATMDPDNNSCEIIVSFQPITLTTTVSFSIVVERLR